MPRENTLTAFAPVTDDTQIRVVTPAGESKKSLSSVLKTYVGGGTITEFTEVIQEGDDAGLQFKGDNITSYLRNVIVGSTEVGAELVVGEGDSYPVPIAFHADVADTTSLIITNATDVRSLV